MEKLYYFSTLLYKRKSNTKDIFCYKIEFLETCREIRFFTSNELTTHTRTNMEYNHLARKGEGKMRRSICLVSLGSNPILSNVEWNNKYSLLIRLIEY